MICYQWTTDYDLRPRIFLPDELDHLVHRQIQNVERGGDRDAKRIRLEIFSQHVFLKLKKIDVASFVTPHSQIVGQVDSGQVWDVTRFELIITFYTAAVARR